MRKHLLTKARVKQNQYHDSTLTRTLTDCVSRSSPTSSKTHAHTHTHTMVYKCIHDLSPLFFRQRSVYRRHIAPAVSASDLLVATNSTFHEPARTTETFARFLSTVLLCGTVFQLTCVHQTSQRTFSERS